MNWGFLSWPMAFFVGMKFMFWVCVATYWFLAFWIGEGTLDWIYATEVREGAFWGVTIALHVAWLGRYWDID